jgi:hypothetical protein
MEFSEATIQQMLDEFLAVDNGRTYFNYTLSTEQNVYAQGTSLEDNYEIEMTSEDYLVDSDVLDADRVKHLQDLGWEIGGTADNFVCIATRDELANGAASKFLFNSLQVYSLLEHEIDCPGYQINNFS